jgi:hypothetical protein
MPQSRSPRKLGDISHLYLSTVAAERAERPRAEAVIWLGAVGGSVNRAHLAAGAAAAFARQGIFVTLLEVCRGLPSIGYYFGLEPADHLAPALERHRAVGGLWNDVVRFSTSADPRSLGGWRMAPVPATLPHVMVVACSLEGGARDEAFLSVLPGQTARLGGSADLDAGRPDAVILAGEGAESLAAARLPGRVRELFPEALVYEILLRAERSGDGSAEALEIPRSLVLSWPKRVPPSEPFFGDLASNLLQRLSQRRRKAADDAASA